jgi:serine/threonine protein kinase
VTLGATREGRILGTAAYMSPEQARGQAVDRRTDIWALGCILYEMLTGRPAFARETLPDTLAAVVDSSPDWNRLPASTPSGVRRLLRRCLQKTPGRRLHDAGDVQIELDDLESDVAPRTPGRFRFRPMAGWIVATALAIALVLLGAPWLTSRGVAAPSFARLVRLTNGSAREWAPAISRDGKWVAYLSDAVGRSMFGSSSSPEAHPRT